MQAPPLAGHYFEWHFNQRHSEAVGQRASYFPDHASKRISGHGASDITLLYNQHRSQHAQSSIEIASSLHLLDSKSREPPKPCLTTMKPNIVGLALWTSSPWCLRDCFCMKATPSSQRTQKVGNQNVGLQNSLTTIQLFYFLRLLTEYTGMQGDGMSASMPDDKVRRPR